MERGERESGSGRVVNELGDPGEILGAFQPEFNQHGNGYGQQHADGAPYPAPEDDGEQNHTGHNAELSSQQHGFQAVSQGCVDHQVAAGNNDARSRADQKHGEKCGGDSRDDGAEGGNEVEGESHDAPQQRKVHVHVIAKQESQKPCNCADEGFNNEIFLNSGQGLGEFADACVAVMPQFIDVRPEAGGFPQEESHQDQNQGGEGQHGS